MKRRLLDVAAFVAVVLIAFIPVIANPRTAPRDIVLVAREMTFYLEGSDVPNPTIVVKRGEDIRLVIRNQDTGITHGFSIPALETSIDRIQPGATLELSWRAPAEPGRHEYVCLPHAQMMKGVLLISD
jgi:heme/copper-type cytochrome/quinol oxidase subunit 2